MKSAQPSTDYEIRSFASQTDWEAWLEMYHDSVNGVWLQFSKKGSAIPSVTYSQALDVALCYGWIDGQSKRLDEFSYLQKFTPRRTNSLWSKLNIERVTRLIADHKMKPAGIAQFEAAKADGRLQRAYDSPSTMHVPDDFLSLLDQHPKAKSFFATLSKTNVYAITWRLQTARTPALRQQRLESIVRKLNNHEVFHQ